jgi:hypothetical protein
MAIINSYVKLPEDIPISGKPHMGTPISPKTTGSSNFIACLQLELASQGLGNMEAMFNIVP